MKTAKENADSEISNEFEAIEQDIRELEEDFGDLGLDDDGGGGDAEESSSDLAELESAIRGTEFERPDAAASSSLSVLEIADGATPQEALQEGWRPSSWGWPGSPIKRAAKKIIGRIVRLVKRYRKFAVCAPAVTVAVVAFRAGKYGTALKLGYSAYKCIRKNR